MEIFEGFLANDKQAIENGLLHYLQQHSKQSHSAVINKYINLEATGLAKLAGHKCMQVEVDTPLIPPGLLPVFELPVYENYDFRTLIHSSLSNPRTT